MWPIQNGKNMIESNHAFTLINKSMKKKGPSS
jgi:hypothetical protein